MLLTAFSATAFNAMASVAEPAPSFDVLPVVEVEVVSAKPGAPRAGDELPTTEFVLRVIASLRGGLQPDDEIVVRQAGGRDFDGREVRVLGLPVLEPGSHAVLGLRPGVDGTWQATQALPSVPTPEPATKGLVGPGTLQTLGDKCVDVLGSDTTDGTPVIYFRCTGNANQDWTFEEFGIFSGQYLIKGIGDKCLRPGAVGQSGFTQAVIGSCESTDALFVRNGNFPDQFRIQHVNTGQCLDLLGSDTDDFTPIILFQCTGSANQDWTYDVTGGGGGGGGGGGCVTTSTSLCLNNRFQVSIDWRNFENVRGSGRVALAQGDSGVFWFFQSDNWELMMKVLDGCGVNNRYWVFFAATTNVEFSVDVTDTLRGGTKTYINPLGNSADAITDTAAFATCP